MNNEYKPTASRTLFARSITRREAVFAMAGLAATALLAGCSSEQEPEPAPAQPQPQDTAPPVEDSASESSGVSTDGMRILTVFFSMPETDDPNSMTEEEDNSTVVIDGEVLGNVQYLAQTIHQTVGGDLFRIEAADPYPLEHDVLVDQAAREKDGSARPALAATIENLGDYDTVFLGFPNWWSDLPMVLYTFLETTDLSGKTIVPFNCHGGSGFSSTRQTIERLQPNATVLSDQGYTVSRNTVQGAGEEASTWAAGVVAGL